MAYPMKLLQKPIQVLQGVPLRWIESFETDQDLKLSYPLKSDAYLIQDGDLNTSSKA